MIVQTLVMTTVDVLVSVRTNDGVAGVFRDEDGAMWLSWRIDRLGGPRLDGYRPDHVGLPDNRTLMGGRLPQGAVGAEAVDDAGQRITAVAAEGAWIAVLDQPIQGPRAPAWCWDASGTPIAPELPAHWPRTRVPDANEPCPACGRTVWDEVTPTDDSRGMRSIPGADPPRRPPMDDHYAGMEPTPFVVCCACGHEESIGGLMRFSSSSDEDAAENKRRFREAQQRIRDRHRESLTTVQFQIFTDQGWPARMSTAQEPRTGSLTASPCSTAHALTNPGLPSESRQPRTIDTGIANTPMPGPCLTVGFIPRDQISPLTGPKRP